ncbi:MAG: hypothetical protein FWG89_08315 [Treponema sp.]|nr:hypothetical protein [Treponema sp.]
MKNYYDALSELYHNYNMLENGIDILLHDKCCFYENCWTKEMKISKGVDWNKISFPHIGEKYNRGLMCIGINMHDHGGINAIPRVVESVKKLLISGKKKYKTSFLWHRIAVYSNIILNKKISPDDGYELSDVYNNIAFVNAIKCSPMSKKNIGKNDRSTPMDNMWKFCPENILYKEITILQPKMILILGNQLSEILSKKCIGEIQRSKNIAYYEIMLEGNPIKILRIKHPASPGGCKKEIYKELLSLCLRASV